MHIPATLMAYGAEAGAIVTAIPVLQDDYARLGKKLRSRWRARAARQARTQRLGLLRYLGAPRASQITAETGFDLETVARALDVLAAPFIAGLVKPVGAADGWRFTKVIAGARRAVGQWPTAESLASQLATAFGQAADEEQDPDLKSRLRQIASFLAETGKDVAAEVLAKVILRPAGLG